MNNKNNCFPWSLRHHDSHGRVLRVRGSSFQNWLMNMMNTNSLEQVTNWLEINLSILLSWLSPLYSNRHTTNFGATHSWNTLRFEWRTNRHLSSLGWLSLCFKHNSSLDQPTSSLFSPWLSLSLDTCEQENCRLLQYTKRVRAPSIYRPTFDLLGWKIIITTNGMKSL